MMPRRVNAGDRLPDGHAARARQRRQMVKASQKDTAIVAGASRATLINLEKGAAKPRPDLSTVVAVLAALGVAVVADSRSEFGFVEVFAPQTAARLVELIAEQHAAEPLRAAVTAETYRGYVEAAGSGRPGAVADVLPSVHQFLMPRLRPGLPIDDALIAAFSAGQVALQFPQSPAVSACFDRMPTETDQGPLSRAEVLDKAVFALELARAANPDTAQAAIRRALADLTPDDLRQVAACLAINAVRAMPPASTARWVERLYLEHLMMLDGPRGDV